MYDCYLCPNDKGLKYSTTNKEGYKEYKSNPKDCLECPLRHLCTESNTSKSCNTTCVGIICRGCFGDAKERHGLRFTRYKGIKRVTHSVMLTFACMNLKKLASWSHKSPAFQCFFDMLFIFYTTKGVNLSEARLLSTV
ncbi:MAG: transposase [Culicoidibacterales bacterium]